MNLTQVATNNLHNKPLELVRNTEPDRVRAQTHGCEIVASAEANDISPGQAVKNIVEMAHAQGEEV